MGVNDFRLNLVGSLAAANRLQQAKSKRLGTIGADLLAQGPTFGLSQGALDMLLHPAAEGLVDTTRILDGNTNILVAVKNIGHHINVVGGIAAAFTIS